MNRPHAQLSLVPTPTDDPAWGLVRAMANGDAHALEALYERFGGPILSFLMARLEDRQLAEEILQDVMLAAWNNAASFRGESKVFTWLLVIARNRAMNAQRSLRTHAPPTLSLDDEFDVSSGDSGLFETLEQHAVSAVVRAAIRTLPAQYREILVLVFYNQLNGAEVAEVLGINIGTVKSRLHRAKESLRRALVSAGGV